MSPFPNENVSQDAIDAVLPFYAESPTRAITALALILQYGGIDGGHHKTWVLDQVVRTLTGPTYEAFVKMAKDGEDGPETYDWDVGIPP